jgi:hypothetical protein
LVKADNTGLMGYAMGEKGNHHAEAPVPTRHFVPAAHYSDAV